MTGKAHVVELRADDAPRVLLAATRGAITPIEVEPGPRK